MQRSTQLIVRIQFSILLALAVAGCGSRYDSYSRVQQVRSEYSAIWEKRAAQYRKEILQKVGAPGRSKYNRNDNAKLIALEEAGAPPEQYFVAFRKGAIGALGEFKRIRRNEPVYTAAISWLQQQYSARASELRANNLEQKELVSVMRNPAGRAARSLSPDQLRLIAYAAGAANELRLIHVDLVRFNSRYEKGFREDKKEVPPDRVPPDYDAIVRGVMMGVNAATGRK